MLELVATGGLILGGTLGLARLVGYLMDRVRRPIDDACEALRAQGFEITHGTMSVTRGLVIALAADGRVALCDIGRRGRVQATMIVECGALEVVALEDGAPLDDTKRGVPRTGALVLRVTHAGRARDVVFAVRVPQPVDAPPDLTEYAQLRSMLAWWRDTLAGRPPEGTYPLAMRLAIYAFGAVPVEVAAARFRVDGRDRIPAAKVISRR